MMSLTSVDLINIVYKQYRYKLKSFSGIFMALILVQAIGILISLNGVRTSGFSNGFYSLNVSTYNANAVIFFTLIWAFTNAIIITTKSYREDDFTFVTNRLSYNLSNILFLITVCVIGGITAMLSRGVIQVLVYFTSDIETFLAISQDLTRGEYVLGILAVILYILLFGAVGYLVGMMFQRNKLLIFMIPVLVFGLDFIRQDNGEPTLQRIFEFYAMEQSFSLFVVKGLSTIVIAYLISVLLTNRLEVRR